MIEHEMCSINLTLNLIEMPFGRVCYLKIRSYSGLSVLGTMRGLLENINV